MMRIPIALARRNLRERRRFVLGIVAAAAVIAAMVAALYSSIGASYDEMLENLPAAVENMFGGADFGTPEGFIQVELFSIVAPGFAAAAGIAVAASALAGAEQSGRLELIVASPVRRSEIVSGALVALVGAVAAVATGLFLGILVGGAVGDLDIAVTRVLAGCLSVALLGTAAGTLALMAGAATGSRGIAVGFGTAVAVAGYAVDAFFPLNSALKPFARASLWYPYGRDQAIAGGLDSAYVLALCAVCVVGVIASYATFERRDLHFGN